MISLTKLWSLARQATHGDWKLSKYQAKDGGFDNLSIVTLESPHTQILGGCGCCDSPFGDNDNDPEFMVMANPDNVSAIVSALQEMIYRDPESENTKEILTKYGISV